MLYRSLFPLFALTASSFAVEVRDISAGLEPVRAKYHLPACAAAVVEKGEIVAMGATGVRRVDDETRVAKDDIWNIGSCTKSMTAVVVGALVDEGRLRWEMPLSEVLPGAACDPGWRNATLWDLVTQRSGLPAFARKDWAALQADASAAALSMQEQRAKFARALLAQPPAEPPGRFAYSNSGYGLLGAIVEQASALSFEELLRKYIFVPLDLKTAGSGPTSAPGKIDRPWGHRRAEGDRFTPVDPSTGSVFYGVLAPGGCVHMSLADFARYAWWLSTGEPRLVKAETFVRLQTPPEGSTYAGGLWTSVFPGIGGEAVCHTGQLSGSFGVFYASRERACVSVFNVEGGGWEFLGDEITAAAMGAK